VRNHSFWISLGVAALCTSCFKGKGSTVEDAAAGPSSAAPAQTAAAPATGDTEKDKNIARYCERKCERECEEENHERPAFFDGKKAEIAGSPFEVQVERVWLKGSCPKGDVPEKRSEPEGITAIVEGKITYTGDDEIYRASPAGGVFLRMSPERYAQVQSAEKAYSVWEGRREITKFTRSVRGADPWLKGQAREFHWESHAIDPGFCDTMPQEVFALLEVSASSLRAGSKHYPVKLVPLAWDEIAGMSVREKVTVRKQKGAGMVDEPAEILYSRFDRVLANFGTGKTEWINHASILQPQTFNKGPGVTFPTESKTPQWTVTVKGISRVKESGGYAPQGEDQFLAMIEVELNYTAGPGDNGKEPKPAKVKAFSFQLETSPGAWQRPVTKACDLAPDFEIAPGSKATGKLAFAVQRFERPFRLEVKTPDRSTLLVDVFSYDQAPEGWGKK
jgi:hypothetical protein